MYPYMYDQLWIGSEIKTLIHYIIPAVEALCLCNAHISNHGFDPGLTPKSVLYNSLQLLLNSCQL